MEFERPSFVQHFGEPFANLFPNEYQLANMILFHLKLPTSEEQIAIKHRAEYQAQMGMIVQHEIGLGENTRCEGEISEEIRALADAKKIEGALFQYSLSGQINALEDLRLLGQTEKKKTIDALVEITRKHDEALKQLEQKFPKLRTSIWEILRKTREIKREVTQHAMVKNKELEEAVSKLKKEGRGKYILTLETDEQWTNYYLDHNFSWETRQQFSIEPSYRLVEFDKDYMMGIGRYAFAYPNGDIFQTIWDLRQKEPQFFNYNPKKS